MMPMSPGAGGGAGDKAKTGGRSVGGLSAFPGAVGKGALRPAASAPRASVVAANPGAASAPTSDASGLAPGFSGATPSSSGVNPDATGVAASADEPQGGGAAMAVGLPFAVSPGAMPMMASPGAAAKAAESSKGGRSARGLARFPGALGKGRRRPAAAKATTKTTPAPQPDHQAGAPDSDQGEPRAQTLPAPMPVRSAQAGYSAQAAQADHANQVTQVTRPTQSPWQTSPMQPRRRNGRHAGVTETDRSAPKLPAAPAEDSPGGTRVLHADQEPARVRVYNGGHGAPIPGVDTAPAGASSTAVASPQSRGGAVAPVVSQDEPDVDQWFGGVPTRGLPENARNSRGRWRRLLPKKADGDPAAPANHAPGVSADEELNDQAAPVGPVLLAGGWSPRAAVEHPAHHETPTQRDGRSSRG